MAALDPRVDTWRDEDGPRFDDVQRTVEQAYLDELYVKAARLRELEQAVVEASSAYGCFAGCTGSLPPRGPHTPVHTPVCRRLRELLGTL